SDEPSNNNQPESTQSSTNITSCTPGREGHRLRNLTVNPAPSWRAEPLFWETAPQSCRAGPNLNPLHLVPLPLSCHGDVPDPPTVNQSRTVPDFTESTKLP
ncbi:Hypothetical predicted protein, partial [Pelobates cultripes]